MSFLCTLLLAATPAAQFPLPPSRPEPTARIHWLDLDGDASRDALVLEPDGTVRLLRQLPGGSFADETALRGLAGMDPAVVALVGDLDRDGALDLLLGGPFGLQAFLQQGDAFTQNTARLGLEGLTGVTQLAWADLDGDRHGDLHVVAQGRNRIWKAEPGGAYVELEFGSGLAPVGRGRSTAEQEPDDGILEPEPRPEPVEAGGDGSALGSEEPPSGNVPDGEESACADSLLDLASGSCVTASSVPVLGALYPLGNEFYIDAPTGYVAIGHMAPAYPLHVQGQLISGTSNSAGGLESALGGGRFNDAAGAWSTVAGGDDNTAGGPHSSVGGGFANYAFDEGGTISGGVGNRAGKRAHVGAGSNNDALGAESVVSGGRNNEAEMPRSTIGGGEGNRTQGQFATIPGGQGNLASGAHSTVTGGQGNVAAGAHSQAQGQGAQALHDGAYVWSDSNPGGLASTGPDQYIVDSAGGVGIGRAPADGYELDLEGDARASGELSAPRIAATGEGFVFPDGTVQSTAQLVGPAGPQGPQGIQGPSGEQGPPGSLEPAERTTELGTLSFTFQGQNHGPLPIYAFHLDRVGQQLQQGMDAAVNNPGSSGSIPVRIRVTKSLDASSVALQHMLTRGLQNDGSSFLIELRLAQDEDNPLAGTTTVTIQGSGILQVADISQRDFDSGNGLPREDVTLAAGQVSWIVTDGSDTWSTEYEYDPGHDGIVDGFRRPDGPYAGELRYQIFGDELGAGSGEAYPCWSGKLAGKREPGEWNGRRFELRKPIDGSTVAMLHFGMAPRPQQVDPEFLPVQFEYMSFPDGQPLSWMGYGFEDAVVVGVRIETVGERVEEVVVIENAINWGGGVGIPGAGYVWHHGGEQHNWEAGDDNP